MAHRTLHLSWVLLSSASISSILMTSFTVDTHNDNGGVVVVFTLFSLLESGISCQAADKKKTEETSFL